MKNRILSLVAVALLGMTGFAQPGRRLESPAGRSLVTIVHVKPESLAEWLDLQKNGVVPVLKKAGVKMRTVYSSGAFGAETIAKALAKLNLLATVVENTILVRQADLSF